ncbi:MAG: helix-hairpin-helix domain-containing protein [Patescibacteria group bacterium]|nr:helix-hairpin-helix domain-containing protein [Patescibacteria group bacterium]
MYQHDMPEKKLEEKLGFTVEDTVNEVGINVNTASSYVLSYISGIDKRSAKKIQKQSPYKSREELKKQLSAKVYEQAAGFLRVPESDEKLDNTDIHPEQYNLARYIIENDLKISDYKNHEEKMKSLYPDTNEKTLEFILDSLSGA